MLVSHRQDLDAKYCRVLQASKGREEDFVKTCDNTTNNANNMV